MTKIVLRLTRSQHMALVDIVLTYCQDVTQPQEFVDVGNDVTTTSGELLTVVSQGLNEIECT